TQHAAHGGDLMDGLVCGHELESLDGIVLVSRANQAAAFERIARSSRSCRFSRRSRRSSSCSSVVRPSVRSPASRAACFTQFRIAWAEGSNSRPSSSGVRPCRTNSIICRRNAGGYARWLFGIVDAPFRPNHGVSTKPGQLHNIPCPSTPTTMPTTNVNPSTNTVRLITPPRVRVCTLRTTRRDHLEAREVLPRGRLPYRDRPNARDQQRAQRDRCIVKLDGVFVITLTSRPM